MSAGAWGSALDVQRQLPEADLNPRRERALELLASLEGQAGPARVAAGGSAAPPLGRQYTLDDVHAAISLTALGGRWSEAMQLMRQLRRLRITPSPMTFSLLISASERAQQWALVVRLYNALSRDGLWRRSGHEVNEAGYDAVAVQAAVRAHCSLGDWEEARRLLGEMEDAYGLRPQRETCERVLMALSHAAQPEALREAPVLLERMLESGPAPGRGGFESAVHALARMGDVDACMHTLKQMERLGDLPVEISTLAAACGGIMRGYSKPLGSEGAVDTGPGTGAGRHTRMDAKQRRAMRSEAAALTRLHAYACERGLLPAISHALADVRGLPPAVAAAVLVVTLDSIRCASAGVGDVAELKPLTVRVQAGASGTLKQCQRVISRHGQSATGRQLRLVDVRAAPGTSQADGSAVDELVGRELVVPKASIRKWLRATTMSSWSRGTSPSYWEKASGGSALPRGGATDESQCSSAGPAMGAPPMEAGAPPSHPDSSTIEKGDAE